MRDLCRLPQARGERRSQTPKPVFRAENKTLVMGTSESGRLFARSFILASTLTREVASPSRRLSPYRRRAHLAQRTLRSARPCLGRQVNHLYPAYDFPFASAAQTDPLTNRRRASSTAARHSGTCQNLPCRDRARDLGRPTIAGPNRSAGQKGYRRSAQCPHLHYGQH